MKRPVRALMDAAYSAHTVTCRHPAGHSCSGAVDTVGEAAMMEETRAPSIDAEIPLWDGGGCTIHERLMQHKEAIMAELRNSDPIKVIVYSDFI